MRSILINPTTRTITEHDYDNNWKTISPLIEADFFDVVYTNVGNIYVDDEGLMTKNDFWILDEGQSSQSVPPIAGSALLFGETDEDGNDTEATISIEDLATKIKFMSREELMKSFI